MARQHKGKLLAGGSILALLSAGIVLTPGSASSQTAGEPSARAPIVVAQSSTEAKPADAPAAAAPAPADASAAPAAATPSAPAVTVVPPATPAPAAAAAPADTTPAISSLSAADQPIAEKIRDLVSAKNSKYFDRKNERDGVEAFYKDRSYAPLWLDNGQLNARAAAAVAYLKTVGDDGLDPAEYATPEIKSGADADALADADLKFTKAVITYVRHAATGRVSFTRTSNDVYYDLDFPDPAKVLAKLNEAGSVGDVLASFEPQHPAYKALKAKYVEALGKTETAPKRIPDGPALKLGKKETDIVTDPRVPLLREKLGMSDAASDVYDKSVAEAVKKYQSEHKLQATGVLTQATVDSINGPARAKQIDTLLVNLERWRWIPHDLRGDTYVMVNVPDYTLKLVRDGEVYWKTKIVAGQPDKPTPLISPDMKFITVNPTWNVPPSIIANEYLPALRQDPTVLSRVGLKMETNKDGTVRIYQPPGEANALGRIRFNFPNKFLVYQHDTPNKNLFALDKRALSHGCMRVQNPLTYAEKLLSIELPDQKYTEDKVKKMLGSNEINIDFPKPLPVHITYQTAFVNEEGNLEFRDDVYGHDARLLRALKSDERKVADVAVEQKGVGSANVSRDALRYEDPNRSAAFENPFLALFAPRNDNLVNNRSGKKNARETQNTGFFGLFR